MNDSTTNFVNFCKRYQNEMAQLAPPGAWRGKHHRYEPDADRERRLGERLKWHASFAALVADSLCDEKTMRPQVVFSRPADLGADLTINATLRLTRKSKAAKKDRELAHAFFEWRDHVTAAESVDAANVDTLLCIARNAAPDPHSADAVAALVAHVEREWGASVPWPFDCETDIYEFAVRATRNEDTMASWLLLGRRPPRYVLTEGADGEAVIEDTDA